MGGIRIVGYTYEADVHCPSCAVQDFKDGRLVPSDNYCIEDENGLVLDAKDREGNVIKPVFSTDEDAETMVCGDCGHPLMW